MSSTNVTKLRKQAAEHEQKRQLDKALAKYIQILDALGDQVDESDIALYNRVGDLLMRGSKVSEAVDYYEKAVDLYTEGGFFNNAIALCNKILRNAPGRASVYYKLGRISAKKGFIADAKQNFLEYADRMQRAGQIEDAFRALAELADLCPDQEDIRLMLADQLARKDRKSEAIGQLQVLYQKLQSEGRSREARATADRMRAIDPDVAPRQGAITPTRKPGDLVFLDVNYDPPEPGPAEKSPASGKAPEDGGAGPASDLPLIIADVPVETPPLVSHVEGLTSAFMGEEPEQESGETGVELPQVDGLETTHFAADDISPIDRLELTSTELYGGPDGGLEDTAVEGLEYSVLGSTGAVQAPADDAAAETELQDRSVPTTIEEQPESDAAIPEEDTVSEEALIAEQAESDLTISGAPAPLLSIEIQNDQSALLGLDESAGEDADGEDTPPPLSHATPRDPLPSLIEIDLVDEDPRSTPSAAAEGAHDAAEDADGGSALSFIHSSDEPQPFDFEPLEPWSPDRQSDPALDLASASDTVKSDEEEPPALDLSTADRLRLSIEQSPDSGHLHQQLGEALLEDGDRQGGMRALEVAMSAYERVQDFSGARSVVEEILRLEPNSIRHQQKRVEYAFRTNDRGRLVDAYLGLADCLFRSGQVEKCRAVYARVVELAPDDRRAREALRTVDPASTPAESETVREGPAEGGKAAANGAPAVEHRESFVNLASWLAEDNAPRSTRMVADVPETEDQEQVDFRRMLDMFKEGVAANVEDTDHESHYDLGVAYKEMGLLDEAIAEFQKALRGTENRIRTYESLGQCFVEKRQFQIAVTILARALTDRRHGDDVLVGVLYLLGTAHEALGQQDEARGFYERILAVDIGFADTGARLAALERGR